MGIHCKTRKLVSNTLSSTGPDTGPCSIEQYVAKKDPFRVAPTNRIPISWPHDRKFEAFHYRKALEVYDEALERRVLNALDKYGIKVLNTCVQKTYQRGFPEAGEDIVFILTQDTDTTRWQEAVDYIYEMVKESSARVGHTMGVEIQNTSERYIDVSSAIIPGTAIYRSLLRVEPVVEAAVRKSCSNLWSSIGFHSRQHRFSNINDNEQPTVVVFIAPGSLAHWGEVEAQIRHAIEAVPFEEDVEIALEILPGFTVTSTALSTADTPTTNLHPRFQHDIPPIPILGASIGPQLSDTESGSLGLVVNFQPRGGGQPQKCFLTAYHVVASGDPSGRAVNDELGIGLDGRAVSQRIEIVYPACCDGEYTKEPLAKSATKDTSPEKSRYAQLVALIEREGVIGEVIHASGLQHTSAGNRRHRMDWALVALRPSKDAVRNLLPPYSAFPPPCTNVVDFPTYYFNTKPGDVILRTGEPAAFSWAGKIYGGIWATAGRVNSMQRTVCWGDGVVSKEVEVLPFHIDFGVGGDDGSMVFNVAKEWVGMVVGSDSEYAGYVTPAADIIADIEARTGGTITLV